MVKRKTKVTVKKVEGREEGGSYADMTPRPIMFGFGLLPDGRRIAVESYIPVRSGERHSAEKVIGQNKYVIGKHKKKKR